jgi:hypothetical protein
MKHILLLISIALSVAAFITSQAATNAYPAQAQRSIVVTRVVVVTREVAVTRVVIVTATPVPARELSGTGMMLDLLTGMP